MLNNQPKWITTQIGAREHYLPPVALARHGLLEYCFTDFWAGSGWRWAGKHSKRLRSVANRYEKELESHRMISFNAGALFKTLVQRCRRQNDLASLYEFHRMYGEWFSTKVRAELKRKPIDPARHRYMGFTTGSLETVQYLRKQGVFCMVQQIDPARTEHKLVLEESARWPGWEANTGRIPASYFARLEKEWQTSSLVAVNSEWSRQALLEQEVPADKLVVIPLGYEPPPDNAPPVRTYAGRPLRVLWLGSVNLRKGIPYLIEAARKLQKRRIEFMIAGPVDINLSAIQNKPENVEFLGTVERNMVPKIFAKADVFVLPTISDGFALTQLEAMAQGLPVITTPNCGQVVTHGKDGFIVPCRDSSRLAEAIAQLDDDRELLARMAAETLNTVQRFSIMNYGARLIASSPTANS
jgi:glycosyltransferase involved in cell wall biosynthesis